MIWNWNQCSQESLIYAVCTHTRTHRPMSLHIRNWHCHNSHLPHNSEQLCCSAVGFLSFRQCACLCASVRECERKRGGRERWRWQISRRRKGFDCMWADSQGTSCAAKEVACEYVCQTELHTLALCTLTKVTLMGMFCTAQKRMTHMHEVVGQQKTGKSVSEQHAVWQTAEAANVVHELCELRLQDFEADLTPWFALLTIREDSQSRFGPDYLVMWAIYRAALNLLNYSQTDLGNPDLYYICEYISIIFILFISNVFDI